VSTTENPTSNRYFVDERGGCVVVLDRTKYDFPDGCLDHNEDAVMEFWAKEKVKTRCEACGHVKEAWADAGKILEEANRLAMRLNFEESQRGDCK
jgi:hypothetical protein